MNDFELNTFSGYVENVVDGDTFDIRMFLGFSVQMLVRFRLKRIDTHELRGGSDKEKRFAQLEKEEAERLILGKEVIVRTNERDKYGRWLADIYYIKEGEIKDLTLSLLKFMAKNTEKN